MQCRVTAEDSFSYSLYLGCVRHKSSENDKNHKIYFDFADEQDNITFAAKSTTRPMKHLVLLAVFATILSVISSCTATRTITTSQSVTQHGDTTTTITTRTIEEYRGKINYQP